MKHSKQIKISICYNILISIIFLILDYSDKTGEGLVVLPLFIVVALIVHCVVVLYFFMRESLKDYKHLISTLLLIVGINLLLIIADIILLVILFNIFH